MDDEPIILPADLQAWADRQVSEGHYASANDYVRELVERDREQRGHQYSLDELNAKLERSRNSGVSPRRPRQVFEAALAQASTNKARRG